MFEDHNAELQGLPVRGHIAVKGKRWPSSRVMNSSSANGSSIIGAGLPTDCVGCDGTCVCGELVRSGEQGLCAFTGEMGGMLLMMIIKEGPGAMKPKVLANTSNT